MKFVILLIVVTTFYFSLADGEPVHDTAARNAMDSEKIERTKRGLHMIYGRCAIIGEKCNLFQHCCDPFDCNGRRRWGFFGAKCKLF
ncbi:hypothetical protein SNE40_021707 [Patella caerulea]|uniref:Uncharacterized protein n=1 Tax=Patella caerulea TaxID=87958 RepID=A0AAN8G4Z4_PATCE